jgi:hypothetical protein
MAINSLLLDAQEIRRRAADIRRKWSPLERLRRTGLPPDIPPKLRQYIMGPTQPGWCVARVASSGKGSSPGR